MSSVKELVGHVLRDVSVADTEALDLNCKLPNDGRCDAGWHFDAYGDAIGRCSELRRREIRAKVGEERKRLAGPLSLLERHGGAVFAGYDETRHHGAAEALQAMLRFSGARPPQRNVILVGPNGLGKTRLLLASHFTLLESGISSRYVTTPELRKWFRRATSYDEEIEREARQWLDKFRYAQAIHFDDAGHVENDQRSRGEFVEGLKSLLDDCRGVWAVSSNRSSEEMERHPDLSGTVASRFMYDADIVVMSGKDFRAETAK